MVDILTFRELALTFDKVVEQPHFDKPSFRINNKVFATLDQQNRSVTLKFSAIDQSVFCVFDPTVIYPAQGSWGKKGWTIIELDKIRKALLADALTTAYKTVSAKK